MTTFTKYANQDVQSIKPKFDGTFDVLKNGRSILHGLTENDCNMAIQFLSENYEAHKQKIDDRLLWADLRHRGLDKLLKPSMVNGGITLQDGYDPLNLAISNNKIIFVNGNA